MEQQNVQVTIYGREYMIKSLKDPQYTNNLARYCDWVMKSIAANTDSVDYHRLVVLALLQVSHNYFELKEKSTKMTPESEAEIEKMLKALETAEKKLSEIDGSLPGENSSAGK